MSWYIYIIRSKLDRLYSGVTINLERRLNQHNGLIPGGAKATRAGRPWEYVYVEEVETRSLAQKRECVIKKLSKKEKLELIK